MLEEIIRMQENLLLIRRTVGWSADEFGRRIGVTRQTINNIESGRNKLTKTQYIAMRSVLDAEIMQAPKDTEMLKILLDVLVDSPEKYSDEEREQILTKSNLMAPAIISGAAARYVVSEEWVKAVGGGAPKFRKILGPAALIGGIAGVSVWLSKLLSDSDENK